MFGKKKVMGLPKDKVIVQTVLLKEVNEQLKKVAKNNGLTMSGLLRLIIMNHLDSKSQNESNL